MSLFSKILDKLGIKKAAPPAAPAPSAGFKASQVKMDLDGERAGIFNKAAGAEAKPVEIPMVDVMGKLKAMAKANPEQLDWKVSIVDLLKLLGLDSSLAARKELAAELGCPPEKMDGGVAMNTWLHKEVLRQLAVNGGNVPKEMLD